MIFKLQHLVAILFCFSFSIETTAQVQMNGWLLDRGTDFYGDYNFARIEIVEDDGPLNCSEIAYFLMANRYNADRFSGFRFGIYGCTEWNREDIEIEYRFDSDNWPTHGYITSIKNDTLEFATSISFDLQNDVAHYPLPKTMLGKITTNSCLYLKVTNKIKDSPVRKVYKFTLDLTAAEIIVEYLLITDKVKL